MTYDDIVRWVETSFLDVRVYSRNDGVEIGQGITVEWDSRKNHASYVKYTDPEDGKVSRKIVVWEFDEDKYKTLALLHELGHHTECQEGDIIYKERRAWEGCFKWMRVLGINTTKDLLYKASEWFSSYIDVYSDEGGQKEWLDKFGMEYLPTTTPRSTGREAVDFSFEPREVIVPYIVDFPFPKDLNVPSSPQEVYGSPKMFGRESWRKTWR